MTADWGRVRELFERALDLDPAERGGFLDRECGGDPELRGAVDELLAADTAKTERLAIDGFALEDGGEQDLSEAMTLLAADGDKCIGGYRILRVLGSGGMSTVFLAEQDHPSREVALKTMRAGMFSGEARRRFGFESEILGRLRHPGIAQVFEAGTWKEPLAGQEVPFFVLEYVRDAVPLDRYVRERELPLSAAIELFCTVCDAVSYGHRIGVIHRDLKPANVLVDPEGRAKIIDFGIARVTDSDLPLPTLHTGTGHVLGTLRYMAPEQLDGLRDEIDTRSDVYALGVILYEILAGQPILDPGTMTLTAFARRVREEEPPPPSRSPAGYGARLPRELDWITRKALARDKAERYGSVAELCADLRHFLADEPVSVGPPTAAYHVRKFVRRNRALVGGVAAAFLVLVAGVITTTWQMLRAESSARAARRQAVRAETINDFYNDLLKFADPAEGRYRSRHDWTVRDALDAAADLFPKLAHEPEAEAQARLSIGNAYKSLGQLEKAEEYLQRAVELREQQLGPDHLDVAAARGALGAVLLAGRQFDRALEQFERVRRIVEVRCAPDDERVAMCALNIGTVHYRGERFDEAQVEIQRAVEIYRRQQPATPRFLAVSLPFLGNIAARKKRLGEAIGYWRESLAMYEAAGKAWHPYAAFVHQSLARELPRTDEPDKLAAAEKHLRRSLEISDTAWGPDAPQTRDAVSLLAEFLFQQRRYEETLPLRERQLELDRKLRGADARQTGFDHLHIAGVQQFLVHYDEAIRHFRSAVAIFDKFSAERPWDPVNARARLAGSLRTAEHFTDALQVAREGYRIGAAIGGEDHVRMRAIALELGKALRENQQYEEAEKILTTRLAIEEKSKDALFLQLTRAELATLFSLTKRPDAARELFAKALAVDSAALKLPGWVRPVILRAHGVFLGSLGEHDAGAAQLRTAVEQFDATLGRSHANTRLSRKNLAALYEAWGRPEDAAQVRKELGTPANGNHR